ncbi:MAG TPA: hypothetical protein VFG75_07485 [Gaiella sp.]|nr:hypothetical protein [Gaiella sp.]
MAPRPLTEARAARLGLLVAVVVVGAQLVVGAAWSLSHDDPTELDLTRRCFSREMALRVEGTTGDPVAAAARGGTLTTIVEGNLVTIAIVTSSGEAERLRAAYLALGGDVESRLEVRGRYVRLWRRPPSPSQRRTAAGCEY